jgi:predicted DNA-binding protein
VNVALEAVFSYLEGMEVHFTPETEKKLNDLAAQSGHQTADELVRDVVEGYFDELTRTRDMLSSRYDDLKSGHVKPVPGEEVEAYFREKSAASRRSQRSGSQQSCS